MISSGITGQVSRKALLAQTVSDWARQAAQNGIRQHDPAWLAAKQFTIGGSSLASIQGNNPYKSCEELVAEKIGLTTFKSDIKMQWGTLFENIIKRYTEYAKNCEVVGDDLYIEGPPGVSYSPDGLAVMETRPGHYEIVLCEFKCPYSRLPGASPPKYYVPQVKMGLDLIPIASSGLLIEGVFRRCTWDQLDFGTRCDSSLVASEFSDPPLAIGIIGLYCVGCDRDRDIIYMVNNHSGRPTDSGLTDPPAFIQIMDGFNNGQVKAQYYPIVADAAGLQKVEMYLAEFKEFCKQNDYMPVGILPWKLFQIKYTPIQKEEGYLAPWIPKIADIIDLVKKWADPANDSIKLNLYNSFLVKYGGGFSDY